MKMPARKTRKTKVLFPTALIAFAIWAARHERVLGLNALLFAALVGLSGAVLYAASAPLRRA